MVTNQRNLPGQRAATSGPAFDQVLKEALGRKPPIRFSAHAQARMVKRDIRLTPEDKAKLEHAVDQADARGAKESLIVLDDLALVVSIKNRVVITAVDSTSKQPYIFTRIDSAVLA